VLAYLSDEWVAAMDRALAEDAAAREPNQATLVVRQVVTGGPDGDRSYAMWFDQGRAGVRPDGASGDEPDVTLTCDWDTAVAVATGKERAQSAFLAGRLTLSGDSRVLATQGAVLGGLDDMFAAVRDRTDFGQARGA
jgi:putative sterol carrier protein